jgi:hypothetical protein
LCPLPATAFAGAKGEPEAFGSLDSALIEGNDEVMGGVAAGFLETDVQN